LLTLNYIVYIISVNDVLLKSSFSFVCKVVSSILKLALTECFSTKEFAQSASSTGWNLLLFFIISKKFHVKNRMFASANIVDIQL
jgi:hypothetical protein